MEPRCLCVCELLEDTPLILQTLKGDFKSKIHDTILASSAKAQACCSAAMIWAVMKSNNAGSAVNRSMDSRRFLVNG